MPTTSRAAAAADALLRLQKIGHEAALNLPAHAWLETAADVDADVELILSVLEAAQRDGL